MKQNEDVDAFLTLLKAGLWENQVYRPFNSHINFFEIFKLAFEQSVMGLVAAGIEQINDADTGFNVPRDVAIKIAGEMLLLERRNRDMNDFIADLVKSLRKERLYPILLKGQGIAQCYERPLWRAAGDVDLLMSEKDYERAKEYYKPYVDEYTKEIKSTKEFVVNVDTWVVELHGTLHCRVTNRLDKFLDKIQDECCNRGFARSWNNGNDLVLLPSVDNDILIIFSHIIKHFFRGGIGLRQLCDWCRLMWVALDKVDVGKLERRLKDAGIMSEWKAFAVVAVEWLGLPIKAMPFYSPAFWWRWKASLIMDWALDSGNFGHNRNYSYYRRYPYIIFKAISLGWHIADFGRYFVIFPLDAIIVTLRKICIGLSVAIKGKRHE